MLETPASCQPHQEDYKPQIWEQYTVFELAMWVHLFTKRATHRTKKAKIIKDLHDAQNYLEFLKAGIKAGLTMCALRTTCEVIDYCMMFDLEFDLEEPDTAEQFVELLQARIDAAKMGLGVE